MYINDIHIAYYIGFIILGLFVGQFIDWMNKRLPEYKKVLTLDIFKEYRIKFKPNYILMLATSIIYICLLYVYGIQDTIIANLDLIKFMVLTPLLLSAFVIDYKMQIIPNRLNLTIFEIGLIFTFLYGLSNVAISINMFLGMFAGAGIFLAITLLGGMFYGKEAMGFGDVKLMGAIRIIFWTIKYNNNNITIIFNWSTFKHIITINKNKENRRVYTFWTIYSNSYFYKCFYTI